MTDSRAQPCHATPCYHTWPATQPHHRPHGHMATWTATSAMSAFATSVTSTQHQHGSRTRTSTPPSAASATPPRPLSTHQRRPCQRSPRLWAAASSCCPCLCRRGAPAGQQHSTASHSTAQRIRRRIAAQAEGGLASRVAASEWVLTGLALHPNATHTHTHECKRCGRTAPAPTFCTSVSGMDTLPSRSLPLQGARQAGRRAGG